MLDRFEKPLKFACLILGLVLLVQITLLAVRKSPVSGLTVPAIPTWIERTNIGAQSSSSARTNALGTPNSDSARTNSTAKSATNAPPKNSTNLVVTSTNTPAQTNMATLNTNAAPTNALALVTTNSNLVQTNTTTNSAPASTNALAATSDKKAAKKSAHGKNSPGSPGGKTSDLPPLVQARIDRVMLSEAFGALPHPVPMGLLGIAGEDVFLRTPGGQTGMIKEGGELDGVKLLKIGINRVLVEHDGDKQELMIFSGVGGESLLSKEKEKEPSK